MGSICDCSRKDDGDETLLTETEDEVNAGKKIHTFKKNKNENHKTNKKPKPKYDFSPFQLAKIKRLHKFLDTDGDGIITKNDMLALGEKMFQKIKKKPSNYQEYWATAFEKLFREPFHEKKDITLRNWQDELKYIAIKYPQEKEQLVSIMFESLFKAIDVNQNGSMNLSEYIRFCQLFGISIYDIGQTFKHFRNSGVDQNKNNSLEMDEFCNACAGYIWDKKPGTGNEHVFGPFEETN